MRRWWRRGERGAGGVGEQQGAVGRARRARAEIGEKSGRPAVEQGGRIFLLENRVERLNTYIKQICINALFR